MLGKREDGLSSDAQHSCNRWTVAHVYDLNVEGRDRQTSRARSSAILTETVTTRPTTERPCLKDKVESNQGRH